MPELDAEDLKLVRLAVATRQRAHVPHTGDGEGAALRDEDGRTYAAATVENVDPHLTTSALRGAVAAAASSGARAFEAAVVVLGGERTFDPASVRHVRDDDLAVLREFGTGTPVHVVGPDGVVHETVTT